MQRRLFTVSLIALLAACDRSSKSTSKKKDADDHEDDEKPAKKKKEKDEASASPVTGGDVLAGWVTGSVAGVSVKLPKAGETRNQEGKGVNIAFLIAESDSDDIYMVTVAEYAGSHEEQGVLTNMREGAFKSMKDKTLTHKDIELDGMKGVETRATTPGPTQGLQRGYWDAKKKRGISIGTVSNKKWDEKVALAFLNSLKIA